MYSPEQDSYFLSDILKKEIKNTNNDFTFLDMGCGSCIQSQTAKKLGIKKITCVDIDDEAIKQARKLKFKAIKSDLFIKVKGKFDTKKIFINSDFQGAQKPMVFDIIAFNPPYLSEHKYDKKADTSGGKFGDETIIRFLKQAKFHLNKGGKIFLLFSSYTPQSRIKNLIKKSYKIENIFEKRLFMEKLFVYELIVPSFLRTKM